jgi:hypothetical protein
MTLISPKGSNNQVSRNQAARLKALDGLRIGLLSNGKLNASLLLRETAACFERLHKCTVSDLVIKHSASKPATEDEIKQLASSSDFLITANGD